MPLKKYFKIFILFIILFSGLFAFLFFKLQPSAQTAQAAGDYHYIRAGATGLNNGTDWANAWTSLPATLVRGDTYYIADGTYGEYIFDDPVSGELYITIKKAIQSDHGTDTGWNLSYGDGQAAFTSVNPLTGAYALKFSSSYWTFDGQTGAKDGRDGLHGFKADYYFTPVFDARPSYGYDSGNAHAVEMGPNISNINFLHTEVDGNNEGRGGTNCEFVTLGIYSASAMGNTTNINFDFAYIHDFVGTHFLIANTHDWTINNSYFSKLKGGLQYEADDSCSGNPSRYIHREPISHHPDGENFTVKNSVFEDFSGTGAIVFGLVNGGDYTDVKIYNNIFNNPTAPAEYPLTNVISGTNSPNFTNLFVYNNVFANLWTGNTTSNMNYITVLNPNAQTAVNALSYNNIVYNLGENRYGHLISGAHDYNICYSATGKCVNGWNNIKTETNGQIISSDPFIDAAGGDFRLNSATKVGCTLLSPYNIDMLGNPRGLDGIWDIGAYEYISASAPAPDTTPPSAPVGVSAN